MYDDLSLHEKLMMLGERADEVIYSDEVGVSCESLSDLTLGQFVEMYEICKHVADLYNDGDIQAAEIAEDVHTDAVYDAIKEVANYEK